VCYALIAILHKSCFTELILKVFWLPTVLKARLHKCSTVGTMKHCPLLVGQTSRHV